MDDLFHLNHGGTYYFYPHKRKPQERLVGQPPSPHPAEPRRPFAPKFLQDLVELYAAGEEPRPDVNECHRSMRGCPYIIYVVRLMVGGGHIKIHIGGGGNSKIFGIFNPNLGEMIQFD